MIHIKGFAAITGNLHFNREDRSGSYTPIVFSKVYDTLESAQKEDAGKEKYSSQSYGIYEVELIIKQPVAGNVVRATSNN